MSMPQGTKRWTTLATWDNEAVYKYFRDERNLSHKHALNSLRKIRESLDHTGKIKPRQHLPYDFWSPKEYTAPVAPTKPAYVPPMTASSLEPLTHTISAPPTGNGYAYTADPEPPVIERPIPAPAPSGNGAADALAALIAPAMVGMLRAELKAAVDAMAYVKELVVLRDKCEVKVPGKVHHAFPKVLQLVHQGLNVMLVGPAGSGKTMLAGSIATALDRPLTMISCSAGMSEAQLLGRLLPLGEGGAFRYVESPFIQAYREGGVILLDEMDAADANLLLVINAALANGGVTVEARVASGLESYVKRHANTVIIAAANTWGNGADTQYVGRGALDVSTLDRFYRVSVDYDTDLEKDLADSETVRWVHDTRRQARGAKLRRVVSTRMLTRISLARAAGLSLPEACADELASWTADERAKVGFRS